MQLRGEPETGGAAVFAFDHLLPRHSAPAAIALCADLGRPRTQLFSRAGYDVSLYDIDAKQVEGALAAMREQLQELADNGLLRDQSVDEVLARVSGTNDLAECVKGAAYVQECTPESLELKRKVFGSIDEVCDEGTIIASSTSCLAPSTFTEG